MMNRRAFIAACAGAAVTPAVAPVYRITPVVEPLLPVVYLQPWQKEVLQAIESGQEVAFHLPRKHGKADTLRMLAASHRGIIPLPRPIDSPRSNARRG